MAGREVGQPRPLPERGLQAALRVRPAGSGLCVAERRLLACSSAPELALEKEFVHTCPEPAGLALPVSWDGGPPVSQACYC